MKKIVSLIILSITSITFYGQFNQYSQIVKPAPYVPPIDLDLLMKGEQYKREQQQQYYEQQRRDEQQKQAQIEQENRNAYNADIRLLNNIVASGYKCNVTASDGWHKVLFFNEETLFSGIKQVLVKDNKIVDFYWNTNYDESLCSVDFSTSIVNCKASIVLNVSFISEPLNAEIYFVIE